MSDWPRIARDILDSDKEGPEGDAARARMNASIQSIFEDEPRDTPRLDHLMEAPVQSIFVSDAELDARIAHGGKEILNNKRIVREIKAYLADHAEDLLTDGEKAVLTDIATIVDGDTAKETQ